MCQHLQKYKSRTFLLRCRILVVRKIHTLIATGVKNVDNLIFSVGKKTLDKFYAIIITVRSDS